MLTCVSNSSFFLVVFGEASLEAENDASVTNEKDSILNPLCIFLLKFVSISINCITSCKL